MKGHDSAVDDTTDSRRMLPVFSLVHRCYTGRGVRIAETCRVASEELSVFATEYSNISGESSEIRWNSRWTEIDLLIDSRLADCGEMSTCFSAARTATVAATVHLDVSRMT